MQVLVTGSSGRLGRRVVPAIQGAGYDVRPFDLVDGGDVRDAAAVAEAAQGCDAIVHMAACLSGASPEDVMDTNVRGMWHVLLAAGERRVVHSSSANAMGLFLGQGPPDYLPLDEDHPCRPSTPYAISKLLAEQLCEHSPAPTISLRAPGVFNEETKARIRAARASDPTYEWTPFWEFGAFLDVRDLATAVVAALTCPATGHHSVLLNASDVSSREDTSRELVQRLLPDIEWRGGEEFEREPFRALVDTRRARTLLNWEPTHTWR